MEITIKYFGSLAELTHCEEEVVFFKERTISELLKLLFEKYPELEEKEFQVAENQVIVSKEMQVINPEIALLPPFSGG